MDKLFNKIAFVLAVIILAIVAFNIGQYAIERKYMRLLEDAKDRCFKEKRAIYGIGYHYFEYRGRDYFVKDIRDYDNEKKWIRVR